MASTWRAAIAALALTAATGVPAMAQDKKVESVTDLGVYPPWQEGRNDDAVDRGFGFTIADADNLADFHGNPQNPLLSLYVGGNYFFAMAPLVAAFEAKYPEYRGRLYWETIPPGLLVRQMQAGGTVTVGNMTWTVKPDVYLAGEKAVEKQIEAGCSRGRSFPTPPTRSRSWCPRATRRASRGSPIWGGPASSSPCPTPSSRGSPGRSRRR
jgi:hypothetical protein